jgi:DNA invertase Pin-like site-specific DNA recombinase
MTEEQEGSFETQCEYYRQLIESDPSKELAGIYGDQVSGLKIENRTEFQQMLADCLDGKIDMIITRSVSRFSRNMGECVQSINLLKQHGIPVIFEKENICSTDSNSELFLSILASMAQEESNHISMNIRWAYRHRAEMGIPGRKCAYGYRKEEKKKSELRNNIVDRKWVIYEPEAKRVRLAFEMANTPYGYNDILNALNLMEQYGRTGVVWTQVRLRSLLLNEAYKGDLLIYKCYMQDYLTKKLVRNNGEHEQFYIEEHHEPIVDPEIFDRVGRLISCDLLNSGYVHKRERFLREERK